VVDDGHDERRRGVAERRRQLGAQQVVLLVIAVRAGDGSDGAELSATFGYPATPFIVTVVYHHGSEAAGLSSAVDPVTGVDLSTVSNSFDGGFVEVDWVPFTVSTYVGTPWVFFAKYDVIRYERGAGDLDGGTLGVRHYLALGPRAAAAIHAEVHVDRLKGVGWVDTETGIPREVVTQSVILGIDFDF
jgi:hypothetical protein